MREKIATIFGLVRQGNTIWVNTFFRIQLTYPIIAGVFGLDKHRAASKNTKQSTS